MKKIDINSIIWSPEWTNFKNQFIEAILNEFQWRISSPSKKRIRDFYGNVDLMLPLVNNLVEFNWMLVVPEVIRLDLEEWIPKIYKETLWNRISGLREVFFRMYSSLNINVCPYCNHTEINDAQYEVDHIHQKSIYKLYALNIYNLIPSCETCNGNKSTHTWFCNFYHDEIYNDMTFKVSANLNMINNLDLDFTLEVVGEKARLHKEKLIKPLYLTKWWGIYNKLTWYVKYRKFPEFYTWLFHSDWYIWNWSEYCCISECSLIHKHKHSKFILDIINDSNYDVLRDL